SAKGAGKFSELPKEAKAGLISEIKTSAAAYTRQLKDTATKIFRLDPVPELTQDLELIQIDGVSVPEYISNHEPDITSADIEWGSRRDRQTFAQLLKELSSFGLVLAAVEAAETGKEYQMDNATEIIDYVPDHYVTLRLVRTTEREVCSDFT